VASAVILGYLPRAAIGAAANGVREAVCVYSRVFRLALRCFRPRPSGLPESSPSRKGEAGPPVLS
jgi:hypothetical protein